MELILIIVVLVLLFGGGAGLTVFRTWRAAARRCCRFGDLLSMTP
jgi:hypothetical protein